MLPAQADGVKPNSWAGPDRHFCLDSLCCIHNLDDASCTFR